ncbi:hypothetical protein [Alistipes sp.]|uniref:hypothetical protein n=1 Tax=Alistipes sp. TaxID=1872444 RepID=UPI0025C1F5FC|nr:hypothetical protein [Alistipes sp.]
MKKNNSKEFFWPSYVDVMTNLFAITLVLFVVSFFLFKNYNKKLTDAVSELTVLKEEYQRIQDMNTALQSLDSNSYFQYNAKYQKHILRIHFEYLVDQYELPSGLSNKDVVSKIAEVGKSVIKTIDDIRIKYIEGKDNRFTIKFLIVIEGQASRSGAEQHNAVLSYLRALSLREYWLNPANNVAYGGLSFTSPELRCELIVSGSGVFGSPREPDYIEGKVNPANQRFLVHIVPVIDWNSNDQI